MIRSAIDVNFLPTVEQARPRRCARCGVGGREGGVLRIYGHGVCVCQQRGPAAPEAEPTCELLAVRRYRCTPCGAVMRVVPGAKTASKHFSGAAIGLALALWSAGKSAGAVREAVNDWRVRGAAARGWRSLTRWARDAAAGRLFAWLGLGAPTGGPRAIAGRVAQALRGYAPQEWRAAPVWLQSQLGACHVT